LRAAQVVVDDGTITAIRDVTDEVAASRVVEAGNDLVLPGLVDTHAHFRDPGYTHKETIASGTRAASLGGVTTVFDMPNTEPPLLTVERFHEHQAYTDQHAYVDYGHNASAVQPDQVAGLAEAGAAAFKLWMSYDVERTYPHSPATALTDSADLYVAFERVAATGRPLFVHPTDHGLYNLMSRRSQDEWGTGFESYARSFRRGDSVVVNAAVAALLEYQRSVGTRLHILHLTAVAALGMLATAKREGRPVTGEANPFAMFVTNSWDNIERGGPFVLGQWVPPEDDIAQWSALVDGTIDTIGSDHAPHTRREKEPGWADLYATPSGSPMIADYLPLLLTAVDDGRLTLERVVELCCSGPARLVGVDHRKGSIDVGKDADVVICDTTEEGFRSNESSPYACGWTPADGLRVSATVRSTFVRGTAVVENGHVVGAEGYGSFIRPQPSAGARPVSA
jgi:dihydroorotase (multifunctional complex type)